MNLLLLRKNMFQEKKFLHTLLNQETARSALKKASIHQIDLLVRILYEITQGNITLSQENYSALQKLKKLKILHNAVGTKEDLNSLMSETKLSKVIFLQRFSNQYCYMLHRLFNPTSAS